MARMIAAGQLERAGESVPRFSGAVLMTHGGSIPRQHNLCWVFRLYFSNIVVCVCVPQQALIGGAATHLINAFVLPLTVIQRQNRKLLEYCTPAYPSSSPTARRPLPLADAA